MKRHIGLQFACGKYINNYIDDVFLANLKRLIATEAICLDVALLLGVIQ